MVWWRGFLLRCRFWETGRQGAKLRQSLLQRSQTLATRRLLEQAVREEVHNAADAVEQSWQQILSNRLAISLAERLMKRKSSSSALVSAPARMC